MKIDKYLILQNHGKVSLRIASNLRPKLIDVAYQNGNLNAWVERSSECERLWSINIYIYSSGEDLITPFSKHFKTITENTNTEKHIYLEE